MSADAVVEYRLAEAVDAPAVAALHADSWRRHYRDVYSDSYLAADVVTDRLAVWNERLGRPTPHRFTVVAESTGATVGFSHVVLDDDPTWGALLDNLHVSYDLKRQGIGRRLLGESAKLVVENKPVSAMYLWVQERNEAAQAFYLAMSGRIADRALSEGPGGDRSRLIGTPAKLRCVWPEPAVLIRARQ